MHVRIDQPRQAGVIAEVEAFVVGRRARDVHDAPAPDRDPDIGPDLIRQTVDQPATDDVEVTRRGGGHLFYR